MPLPPPTAERAPVHARTIALRGYRRADGLWDVEGHLQDVRDAHFTYPGGERDGGHAIHSMWLRLTVDSSALIVAAVADTDAAPFPDACGDIAPAYAGLVGLRVGPGFHISATRLLGGVRGCTHMSELLRTMATGVIQTLAGANALDSDTHKPFQLDGCHALATDGPRVRAFYPRWYRPAGEGG